MFRIAPPRLAWKKAKKCESQSNDVTEERTSLHYDFRIIRISPVKRRGVDTEKLTVKTCVVNPSEGQITQF
jgi:hypothetical protein